MPNHETNDLIVKLNDPKDCVMKFVCTTVMVGMIELRQISPQFPACTAYGLTMYVRFST